MPCIVGFIAYNVQSPAERLRQWALAASSPRPVAAIHKWQDLGMHRGQSGAALLPLVASPVSDTEWALRTDC